MPRSTSSAKKGMLGRYSPASVGNRAKIPSNGHCRRSPNRAHCWIIASPNGKTSWGTCRWCGEAKEFSNIWTTGFTHHGDKDIALKEDE